MTICFWQAIIQAQSRLSQALYREAPGSGAGGLMTICFWQAIIQVQSRLSQALYREAPGSGAGGLTPGSGNRFIPILLLPGQFWDPSSPPDIFSSASSGESVNLMTHFHLVLGSKLLALPFRSYIRLNGVVLSSVSRETTLFLYKLEPFEFKL
jgi:hypothetical protein